MTDTTDIAQPGATAPEGTTRRAPLSQLRLGQLQELATSLGVQGTAKMRKSDLLEAIRAEQGGSPRRRAAAAEPVAAAADTAPQGLGSPRSLTRAPGAESTDGPVSHGAGSTDEVARRDGSDGATRPARGGRSRREAAASSIDLPPAQRSGDRGSVTAATSKTTAPVEPGSADGGRAASTWVDRSAPARDGDARTGDARNGDARNGDARTGDARTGDTRTADAGRDGAAGDGERPRTDPRMQLEQGLDQRERARSRRGRQRDGDGGPERQQDRQPDRQQDRQQGGDEAARGERGGAPVADRQSERGDRQQQQGAPRDDRGRPQDDDEEGGRRGRRGRYRDRKRRGRPEGTGAPAGVGADAEPEVGEDDVLVPVAGILDILDSYAFVRTAGYLPSPNDVYVSLGQVKKNGMRKGDAITGAVRQQRDGEQEDLEPVGNGGGGRGGRNQRQQRAQKFNALVRIDTVNGLEPDGARRRPDFSKLTPLYPQERLRMETDRGQFTQRVIDLVAPIGKGQRGLIVAPPKAGKTIVMQQIANAITRNDPDVHLMVVLVDERPEEVTDMQRTVKGEVIASTFDRPAEDHTTVAELAIERAKRLVEQGHDVVVLLDSLTRLSRAYNTSAPASGRILSGGIDASALYPPKRFFGAARNIENGGSLTILASALVETGSKADEVIFEEFKGTGNMELRLARHLADKRIFPAVDVNASGTRREEILMNPEELKVVYKLRRVLGALDSTQAIELVLGKLRETGSNAEFLMQVQRTSPAGSEQASELAPSRPAS